MDAVSLAVAAGLAGSAKAYADAKIAEAIAALPKGVVWRGSVNYYADLPATPEPGDCYTVKYAGSSGTSPSGQEYAWGKYDGVNQWIPIGPDMSVYRTAAAQDVIDSGKADKVTSPTAGNFAGLDANGNLTDSGKKAADFATAAQGTKADLAVLVSSQTLTDADKKQALLNLDGIRVIKLTDGTETLAQIAARLATINADGEHIFFDVAALTYPLYLCTIAIDYTGQTATSYRLNDLVTGKTCLGVYDGTKTLNAILSEAVSGYYTLTITCVTQDGVTVTGQTVTVRASDAQGAVYKTLAYNGQPVSVVVPNGFAYYISVSDTLAGHFNPTTATGVVSGADASVILSYSDIAHITTFEDVKSAVEAGAGNAIVGVEIADTWIATNGTSYDDPMVVASVETVQDADGVEHTAAIMQRKYASLNDVQFDAPEVVLATGNYEENLYYYVSDSSASSTFRLLIAGTDYNVGDAITGTVYKNSIRDTTGFILKYGYNRYRDSAYRQFLNSAEPIGGWWSATHVGDVAPAQLTSLRGYKAGCSAALLAAAKPCKQNCYTNSVTDGSVVDTMCDLFWLPSGIQMYGTPNANEGVYWKYWKDRTGLANPSDASNAGRIPYAVENHISAQWVRLRSAYRGNSYNLWSVHSAGYLSNYSANSSIRCAPACAIY